MEEKKQENQFSGMTREEIILEAKKQILHSAVLALAALIVIGVACYAWFASNKNVTAKAGSVSVAQNGFELASVGAEGVFDEQIPDNFTVPTGETWPSAETQTGTYTAGQQAILWRMSDESNLGNSAGGSGISPGSKGSLQFYVIPNRSGEMHLKCTLDVIPLPLKEDGTEDRTAEKLLRGHLLFDYQYAKDTENVSAIVPIESESFIIDLANAEKEKPVKVTLNWRWPYVLEDAYQDSGEVLGWVKDREKSSFFYCAEDGNPVDIGEKNPLVPADYLELSEYYNNADQYIGNHVNQIILQLIVEQI